MACPPQVPVTLRNKVLKILDAEWKGGAEEDLEEFVEKSSGKIREVKFPQRIAKGMKKDLLKTAEEFTRCRGSYLTRIRSKANQYFFSLIIPGLLPTWTWRSWSSPTLASLSWARDSGAPQTPSCRWRCSWPITGARHFWTKNKRNYYYPS